MAIRDRSAPAESPMPRAKSLFLAAIEIDDAGRRARFLEQACGDDASLRGQVERLLVAADGPIAQRLQQGVPLDDPSTARH